MKTSPEGFPGKIESTPEIKKLILDDLAELVKDASDTDLVYGTISGTIQSVPTEYFEKVFDTTKAKYLAELETICHEIQAVGFPIENLKRRAFIANASEGGKNPEDRTVLKGGTRAIY